MIRQLSTTNDLLIDFPKEANTNCLPNTVRAGEPEPISIELGCLGRDLILCDEQAEMLFELFGVDDPQALALMDAFQMELVTFGLGFVEGSSCWEANPVGNEWPDPFPSDGVLYFGFAYDSEEEPEISPVPIHFTYTCE